MRNFYFLEISLIEIDVNLKSNENFIIWNDYQSEQRI